MYVDIRIVRLITPGLVHHVDAPQYSNATIGAWSEIFLIVQEPDGALSPSAQLKRVEWVQKATEG